MPQELWVIFLGWVAVIAMPVVVAAIIWASIAERKRVSPARPRSRERHLSSDRAGGDSCIVMFGSGPGELATGRNQVEGECQSAGRDTDIEMNLVVDD